MRRKVIAHGPSDRSVTTTTPSLTGSASWTGWLVAVMAGTMLLYGIDNLFGVLPSAVSELFQKFVSCSTFFGAAALCVMKGRESRDERSVWWLFALSMTLWGAGEVYFALVLWDSQELPVPSIADGFWLIFYLPAYAALCTLVRRRSHAAGRGVWLDALVGGLGVGGAGAMLVFGVVLAHTDGTAAETATNLAYPLGDLGLLALVVAAMTVIGWKASVPYAGSWPRSQSSPWLTASISFRSQMVGTQPAMS